MLTKEEANTNKIIVSLDQKLSRINSNLMIQKDLKMELENKNCIMKNECLLSFQELELELIKLQSNLKYVCNEKLMLKEDLNSVLQESLAWERKVINYYIIHIFCLSCHCYNIYVIKVQLIQNTIKDIKEAQNTGNIASMKSEIHRMEMRLSYLKKIQEKLIHDMNLCVTRRNIIVDKVFGKLKRNSKVKHNEKIVMHKRLSDQRAKIKQLSKVSI